MEKTQINSVNLNPGTDILQFVLNITSDESYPCNFGIRVMHWWGNLRFIYVIDGETETVILEQERKITLTLL